MWVTNGNIGNIIENHLTFAVIINNSASNISKFQHNILVGNPILETIVFEKL